ncbi:S-adenosyl-L-methionine-dependent methyltransferase [Lasiosphaeris hirsuta]|uniref:S-adenosyl-L-methionine-dependent methyltransferase n=1 Tax=Lasiosphaeris hirsuta TaxID=260670 RepID=A0AA39ZVT4_9PEZI|nr:S-adenosyl-L-methionine-dependent methyltransferase [Lasiosphaeris hirsuta]
MSSNPPDLKARLKASYDAIAPAYNAWSSVHNSLRLRYLSKLLALLPPNDSPSPPLAVLELGCGAGTPVTETLVASPGGQSFHVTANDLSSTQIALGQAHLASHADRVTWLQGDMMTLEFADGSFDAIVALYSVIHLPREEQDVLIGRIAKWLKPGGVVLVNFAAEDMEAAILEKWLAEEGWMFWSGWGAEATLEKIRGGTGLEVVVEDVIKEEEGADAAFLWVIAKAPAV